MSGKPFVLSVKALVLDDRGRFLVLRRSPASRNNAGRWDFPGGKIDAGESFDEALIREVAEETGLAISLDAVFGACESEMPDRKVAYLFMRGHVVGGELRLSPEHDDFAWLTPDELGAADVCPQFQQIVRHCCRSSESSC